MIKFDTINTAKELMEFISFEFSAKEIFLVWLSSTTMANIEPSVLANMTSIEDLDPVVSAGLMEKAFETLHPLIKTALEIKVQRLLSIASPDDEDKTTH